MAEDERTIEAVVCNVKDMPGKMPMMKEVDVGTEGKCLLIRHEDGELTALGHKCTHYGAPLARGALSNGIVRCPWHGACFNAKTGDIEDYPGLDSLHKFQVTVDKRSGEVKVRANAKHLTQVKRNSCLESGVDACGKDENVVIIGGGPASLVCAETLRKEGFVGGISVVCREPYPPYDRAKLSKAPDAVPDTVYLRADMDYYRNIRVELMLNTEAVSIDPNEKKVLIRRQGGNDDAKAYNRLFIATGGKPRTLHPMPGWESDNILTLRTVDDANKLASVSKGKRVVLVGSSFIAMEIAAYLAKKKESASITVVCGRRSKVPFEASLGCEVGGLIMKMHEERGITFHTSVGLTELICDVDNKKVRQVKLSNDTVLDADVIILGIGVVPATDFLKPSGIQLNERGFAEVDFNMRTNIADVYAGGDIVTFPLAMKSGEATNIQHWQMAHTHGRIAAQSIVDSYVSQKDRPTCSHVESVPFFWTVQFGISIRYAGHVGKFDKVIVKGLNKDGKVVGGEEALAAKKFVAFYAKNDEVFAVATMMADPIAARFAETLRTDGAFKLAETDKFLRGEMGRKQNKDQCRVS